jgi:predicted transcriptional regulator
MAMSKTLTFEVPDELYEAFEQVAARSGRTTESVALEWIARRESNQHPQLTDGQRKEAREKLLRYAGIVRSGNPRSADNEQIDADLAREYGADSLREA